MGALAEHGLCGFRLVKKLSELEIDADKDWQGHGISNLKEVTASMVKGDQPKGGTLGRLVPGNAGDVLTSQGPGNEPTWS